MNLENSLQEGMAWKARSATAINPETKAVVVCHECRKVLYQMPVDEITGVYRRVALGVMIDHSFALQGHRPEIIFVDKNKNEMEEKKDRAADLMGMIYPELG